VKRSKQFPPEPNLQCAFSRRSARGQLQFDKVGNLTERFDARTVQREVFTYDKLDPGVRRGDVGFVDASAASAAAQQSRYTAPVTPVKTGAHGSVLLTIPTAASDLYYQALSYSPRGRVNFTAQP
jgi:hypothetical protein